MQTVNFNCPHCGNLMAVGANLLGRNVRCPHCKQVVRAPAAAGEAPAPAAAPPPPTPVRQVPSSTMEMPPKVEHHESIFGERHDEDVFGSEPPKPTLPPAPPVAPAPPLQVETVALPPPIEMNEPATDRTPDFHSFPTDTIQKPPEREEAPAPEPPVRTVGYRPRLPQEHSNTPAFTWILLAYAALATAAAGFFGYQYFTAGAKGEHPYKVMPDVIRQFDPAKKPQAVFNGMPDPKLDVPGELRVKLGAEIAVGDLLVQPVSVEKRPIVAMTRYVVDPDKRSQMGRSLILTMRVKNLSKDTAFYPNDPAFGRALDTNQKLPYTALEFNGRFHYGSFKWPLEAGVLEQYILGCEDDREETGPLKPGDERHTYAAVAATGARSAAVVNFEDALAELPPETALLWRVQLRRGLVALKNDDGQDVDVSATTVIGVEFRKDQIKP